MSFTSVLRTIVEECGGGLGAALMGADGIPIEQVAASTAPAEPATDVATLGVQFGRVLGELHKAADSVGGGALEELALRMANFWVLIEPVDDENYLVVAVDAGGNPGKARFLMRRHRISLRELL